MALAVPAFVAGMSPRFRSPGLFSFPSDCFRCRAELQPHQPQPPLGRQKKVVVVGSGWSGLGAAHHLSKQGFDVTVLEGSDSDNDEAGVGGNGFWYPYSNIYSVIDELGNQPFTKWTKSALRSPEGVEVELPLFQDLPRLPTPFGPFLYPQFSRLPLVDRLTAIPLIVSAIDFDNTDTAWRKYDTMTARELFKQFGCSETLHRVVFEPMLQVGLFAASEQCSAAAALGMFNYYILAHQQHFDVRWCRGTLRETIIKPWKELLKSKGCKFYENQRVVDLIATEDSACISSVVCDGKVYEADVVIFAVGIFALQSIVSRSSLLKKKQEFLNVLNLSTIDVVSVKLWMNKKVDIPSLSNICFGFDDLNAWTFFDLNSIYDEHKDEASTVVKADFYCANQLLPLTDEHIVAKVVPYITTCIKELETAMVIQQVVTRYPQSATHFSPGSYKYMMRGSTTFQNVFMAGDWIISRHGSWSQEKAYVSGLEAANRAIDYLNEGEFAKIIPLEDDEPHIEALRSLNRNISDLKSQTPFFSFFLQ